MEDARKHRILIIEDNKTFANLLKEVLEMEGFETHIAESLESGKRSLANSRISWDIAILDLKLPDGNGSSLIRPLRQAGTDVLILTAHGGIEEAVRCTKLGAYNFFTKPIEMEQFVVEVKRIAERRELECRLRRATGGGVLEKMLGQSRTIAQIKELVRKVAPKRVTVLITGESGTGKELVAQAIHELSGRSNFVAVNCGAIPENLFESELFGYEKGAFTGANGAKPGKIEMADGGTLFLDEISELPFSLQVKLLRFLETSEVERLGSTKPKKVDVRVIAATNRDLDKLVKEGTFREDLYFRLKVVEINVPPLRERKEDVPLLATYFLKKAEEEFGLHPLELSDEAMMLLMSLEWSGNVRELKNAIYSAAIRAETSTITPEVFVDIFDRGKTSAHLSSLRLEEVEKRHIERVLERVGWNVKRAAKLLGISRSTLYTKMKKWGIKQDIPNTET